MPPDLQTQPGLLRSTAAFSLVEIAMSLAIAMFSLVGLIGMLPVGLGHFREAMDTTIGSQIAQRVVSDAEQTDFDRLLAGAETSGVEFFVLPVRYFDEQGTEVVATDAQAANKVIYHVRVRGSQPGPADPSASGSSFTSLPADMNGARFRPRDSVFLTVQVAAHPGLGPLPVDEARQLWRNRSAPMSNYRAVITRNGTLPKTTRR